MLYEFITGWISWIAICGLWLWFASRDVRANRRSENSRIDFATEVFVLSMSLNLGGVALLYVSYETISNGPGDSVLPFHPIAGLGALFALFLGLRTVPRLGDRLAKPAHLDD